MIKLEKLTPERAIVVGLVRGGQSRFEVNDYLDELELLAETAGAEILERVIQERDRIEPAYMIGKGKVAELAQMAKYMDCDLVIFDDDLSPAQVKNIENICGIKVLDRSGLILDIFAKHARTREARTQVELAQLNYIYPRLTRQWTHLSRQVGGIGVRGPGETQLEVDRRLIRLKIGRLEKDLVNIAKQRRIRRKNRKEVFKAALVGYTNVGKSTILNALTNAAAEVENRLFVTLDATVRATELSDHSRILLIDTVGFIRKLPHHLVASFKSTLEEAQDADMLIHVIDISHPLFRQQMQTVQQVLEELNIADKPRLNVFNKIDLIDDESLMAKIKETEQPCVFISAQRGIFLQDFKEKIRQFAEKFCQRLKITMPIQQSPLISKLHEIAEINNVEYIDSQAIIDIKVRHEYVQRIKNMMDKINSTVETLQQAP